MGYLGQQRSNPKVIYGQKRISKANTESLSLRKDDPWRTDRAKD